MKIHFDHVALQELHCG